jgi:hypothetical protein
MKILVSMASCANNTERTVLRAFYEGMSLYYFEKYQTTSLKTLARSHGIALSLDYEAEIDACDIAVQFGVAKDRVTDHHVTRQSIKKQAKHIIYVETPVLGRTINNKNDYEYYRIGIDGFLNDQGLYHDDLPVYMQRSIAMRQDLDIPEFPGWKNHLQGHILILLQLPGDASLRGQSLSEWLIDTVDRLRKLGDRRILIRLHPTMSQKSIAEFMSEITPLILKNYNKLSWSDGKTSTLAQDLGGAGLAVTYSSGSSVDAILKGVPVVCCDPGCLAYPVATHWIEDIDSLNLPPVHSVTNWLDQLCMSQWTAAEMRRGDVWKHYVSVIENF